MPRLLEGLYKECHMHGEFEFDKFNKVTVLGPGMIGASFSRALKARGLATHVVGCARNEDVLKTSVKMGYIDSAETDPIKACEGADLVMLATPVDTFMPLVSSISSSLKKGAIVIDAGSVKGPLAYNINSLMPEGVFYVPCHPIAGNEGSGPSASSPDLFIGSTCIITPLENSDPVAIARISGIWEALGASVENLDPMHHDKVYALVSHFPHLVMYAMVNTVSDIDASALRFTGAGFDDSTRIAKSSSALWRTICMMNSSNLIECINVLIKGLDGLKSALESGDGETFEAELRRAQTARLDIKGGR